MQNKKTRSEFILTKLTIKDLITTGIFTAIYFVLLAISTFSSFMLIPGISFLLLPVIAAFLCAIAYMLMVARVQKFGAITILSIVIGLFFGASGHFITAMFTCIICGIVADVVANIKKYKSYTFNTISHIIYAFSVTGPILPMWFFRNQYTEHLTKSGYAADNIANRFSYINPQSFLLLVVAIIMTLPNGYDTQIAELGDNFSSGQKQRLGLARIFLHESDIILLDEPTSNLDILNEKDILRAIKEHTKNKIVVLVSHKDTTLDIANKIISL